MVLLFILSFNPWHCGFSETEWTQKAYVSIISAPNMSSHFDCYIMLSLVEMLSFTITWSSDVQYTLNSQFSVAQQISTYDAHEEEAHKLL